MVSNAQKDGQQGGPQDGDKKNDNQQPCKRGVDPACTGPKSGEGVSAGDKPKPESAPSLADKAYDNSVADSKKIIEVQDKAIADKTPDVPTKEWKDKYTADKDETIELKDVNPPAAYSSFFGLKSTSHYKHLKLISKKPSPNAGPFTNVVHEGLYSKEDQAIIAKQSYANRDAWPKDQRVKWYEFAFKNWLDTAGATEAKKLKWVVRDNIQNGETKYAIKRALERGGPSKVDANGHGVFVPNDEEFKALAAGDNGRGVFYLTGRYHQQLGDLKVVKIHAWKVPDEFDGKYYMALELGH
ncbi:MAG: hypothetical protein Q9160_006902 [Pyrenula sp. 1 TL-2023]